jgi:hypothetical protein
MVPNHPQLPSAKAKRKSNRNVCSVCIQYAGLLQATAMQRKTSGTGRSSGWADQKETGNLETGQRQEPASMSKKRTVAASDKNGQG